MISAPRIVVVSVIFFPMGLFYYSSANGSDYTISARNPTAASAMKGSPLSSCGILQPDASQGGESRLAYDYFRFVR